MWRFGSGGPPDLEEVPVPAGEPCFHCEEPIEAGGSGFVMPLFESFDLPARAVAYHRECHLRQVFGSVGHQRKECPCYGGSAEDPPGMTRREAAAVAVAHFRSAYFRSRWRGDE